jgi:hypothetical protein
MNDFEQQLIDHFRTDGDQAAPEFRLDDVVSASVAMHPAASTPPRSTPPRSWLRPAVVAASVAAVTVGGLIIATREPPERPPAAADGSPPPLPAGLPRTGVDWTPQGSLALTIASQTLAQECMSDAGWDYDIADPSAFVTQSGMWSPHPVLGIGTVEAAEANGYHRGEQLIVGPETFAQTLAPDEQPRFYDALTGGDDTEPVPITLPDGTSNGAVVPGGCLGAAHAAFDNLINEQEGYRQVVNETGIDQEQVAGDTERDPRIQSALTAWRACLADVAGEMADTPNELARRFAFEPGVTAREIEIATADARCQLEIGLANLWSEVYAEYQRYALGDAADLFDTLALIRVDIIDRANEVLDERGIRIPEF